jgi:1,2-diacylglycerol 3-alpha-glucosyltransferase
MSEIFSASSCRVAVIWIDWYAYHVARFRGLNSAPTLSGRVVGIELVGGIGVHAGLKFRENLPPGLAIETLLPDEGWRDANKWRLCQMLWSRLSELSPSVILVPGYYTLPGFAIAFWAKLHGRSSVLMTESTAFDHKRIGWKEKLKGFGMRVLFDWAVAGGKAHVAYLAQLGFPQNRVVGCYDVVENESFREGVGSLRLRSAQEFSLPSPYFLYVGRLAEEKNVLRLLQSWLKYRENGGSWPLVLVGDGPEAESLRKTARSSSFAADVLFPGLKGSRELFPYYAFAGCFILPSTREPWGLVVNEAMASSLPVLVSDRCGCGIDLVKPGINGFLFDPYDQLALTMHLHSLEATSDVRRKEMGRASYEIVKDFSPEHFGLAIASIADSANAQITLQTVTRGSH